MTATAEQPTTTTDLAASAIREHLVAALKFVNLAVAKRPPIAVLSGVLIEGHGDHLTMCGFDFELAIREKVAGTGTGRALVPGHLLLDLLKDGERNGIVDLFMRDGKLAVVTDGVTYTLQTLPLEDYPALPPTGTDTLGRLTAAEVLQLPDVTHAAGRDDTLPILTAVMFDNSTGALTLAATDRYRLAVLDTQASGVRSALVPAAYVEMTKHLKGAVTLTCTPKMGTENLYVTFTDEAGRSYTVRELEGDFPKYRSLIPSEFTGGTTVQTADMVKAVKQVAKVAQRNTPVALQVRTDTVALLAGSSDEAQARKAIPGVLRHEEIDIAFNPRYLLDALGTLGADATIRYTTPVKPAVFTSAEHPNYRVLVMPTRMAG